MPRKPTLRARQAKASIAQLVVTHADPAKPLPTLRELGTRFGLNYSSIFRILVELSHEAVVWQHPNGRFYPAASQQKASQGLPVVLIGRQMRQWSVLYQEIIEGISEVCTHFGSPLVLLSSDQLVDHSELENPPLFGSEKVQCRELERLNCLVPKSSAAVIFDHLWSDPVLEKQSCRPGLILMRETNLTGWKTALPDFRAGAHLMLRHLIECGYEEVQLLVPFEGDASVRQCSDAFEKALAMSGGKMVRRSPANCETPILRRQLAGKLKRLSKRVALVAPEDNVAVLLHAELSAKELTPERVGLVSLQGTGAAMSPLTRLRYDYRRLGRAAASALLTGDERSRVIPPLLVEARTTVPLPML